jgi:MFS family permease
VRDPIFTRDFNLVFAANVLQGLSFFLFIHLPRFLTDIGAGEIEIGVIIGVTAIAAIASRPTIGRLMDTRGRRPIIIVGGILNLISVTLYLTVDALGVWIYVVRILHGVSEGMMFTSLFTYGADVVPASRRTEGLALFGVSGFIPMALGGVVGDVILEWRGFDELFFAAAICGAGALALGAALPERAPHIAHGVKGAGFFSAIRRPDLAPIWWMTGVFSLVLTSYFTFLRTFVDDAGFGSVGAFFVAYSATAILLRMFFAWVPDRVGPKRVLYPALAVLGAGFLALGSAGSGAAIAVAGVLTGAGHGYAFPILFGFTVTRAPAADRGSALAFFTALFDVGLLFGGPLLGWIITASGYPAMFRSATAILVAGTVVYGLWDRKFTEARDDAVEPQEGLRAEG